MNKKLLILAALAAGAWYFLTRGKSSGAVGTGGGSAVGAGLAGSPTPQATVASKQPGAVFNVSTGTKATQTPTVATNPFQSAVALGGDITGLIGGVGGLLAGGFNAISGLFSKKGESTPFSTAMRTTDDNGIWTGNPVVNDAWLTGYDRDALDPAFRNATFTEWGDFGSSVNSYAGASRDFSLGETLPAPADNVVNPVWENPFGTSVLSYSDAPWFN